MSEKILAAINRMDPENDNHWTVDGLAKLDTVKFLAGQSVSREELEIIAPGFNRESLRAYRASQGGTNVEVSPGSGLGSGGGVAASPPVAPPPPAPVQQAAAEPGPTGGETQIEALAAQIDREKQTIVELERIQKQAGVDILAATARMDAAQIKLNELSPPETPQQTIMRHLHRQVEIGQQKAALRAKIQETGVDLQEVAKMIGGSPLDQAMRQRHRRRA